MTKPIIGLLGGGQLGQMLCQQAGPLGVQVAVLDAEGCPAKQANHNDLHVTGSFKDPDKIRELASRCDMLTIEVEHVETNILEEIATQGIEVRGPDGKAYRKKVPVHPSWKTIRLIQDKYEQKEYFIKKGIPVAQQMAIESSSDDTRKASLQEAATKFGLPFMLKGAKGSYDGRGNYKVRSAEDFEIAAKEMGNQPLYAEKWVPFELELAVMVMRLEDDDGNLIKVVPYPVVETIHEDSICTTVYYPPRKVADEVKIRAQKVACDVIANLWGRGVFAVEMFLLKDGQIMVNEVAPRPHNSGHYTIEAVPQLSQYKAQICALLNTVPEELTLAPRVPSALMVNILGGAKPDSHDKLVELTQSMGNSSMDVYLHQYGKESKPGRKIGHITATGFSSISKLAEQAQPLIDAAAEMRAERVGEKFSAQSQGKSKGVPLVAMTMGSDSDLTVMSAGLKILDQFNVPYEVRITSAHRTPELMSEFAEEVSKGGVQVIIAGAGGAAHLPGMLASETHLPVIGVPVKASVLDGVDSLYSIVQMPRGVPCLTVGINNSTNAALAAIRILGASLPEYAEAMKAYQARLKDEVYAKDAKLSEVGHEAYLKEMLAKK
ncbi:phosphoribosylaminoimidazole carboxylase ade2 [Pestalotiopsis sp. 9143b]|nr:phosphoribosylaminoimidazole carboxylase ade2 [Pestalotiopsis sp. 9143b]